MKRCLLWSAIVLFVLPCTAQSNPVVWPADKAIAEPALHPRYRNSIQPKDGKEVKSNPPALLWPAAEGKGVRYRVELSRNAGFVPATTVVAEQLPWAMYTHHQTLEQGTWYWRYATTGGKDGVAEVWSAVYSFVVDSSCRVFATPDGQELLRMAHKAHPRLYVTSEEKAMFVTRNRDNSEAKEVIHMANKYLKQPLPLEEPTRPRDTTGKTDWEKQVLMRFMYHGFGDKVKVPIQTLCMAYLLTDNQAYVHNAVERALSIANMDPKGWATEEDFNSASCMLAMATAYDHATDILSEAQKQTLLAAIKLRGDKFFAQYANKFETQTMDNHVWQHTLRRLFMTSLCVAGDLPEADTWLRYCYEVWCCRFPVLGADDGGWHDGPSYFQVNFETFAYIPFYLTRLTGVNFYNVPWLHNLPSFLIYAMPPASCGIGFGDNYEKMVKPTKMYLGA